MDITISYVAVMGAAIVAYAVGALWHSPVGFGKYWMRLMGFDEHSMKSMPLSPTQAMTIGFFVTLLMAYVLAHIAVLVGATAWQTSLELGFWVWLGFLAPTLANGWLWEGKTPKLFVFNAAYALVNIEIMALVLGLWH
ncbi:hypothetical protein A2949_00625 [Candidatus Adlerbacteria bacterium RIFCSPLOWO2_01_FULL_54_21b]|uniref:DUF1761 domain-containing protein n=1 Tax=Candidatus Adlerbacteria bacterium RIFCSPLOWO2_01_FULL_54_21b TaxID=1797245 RepID=A0A1F4XZX2_9BACT|nr:MAG: hypothetical protein A2949_00625 [Candidatus Adlerbacteria bacterium RIFCSPLOWO2_01_FULL_54_21b]